jgi:hypothetical protein
MKLYNSFLRAIKNPQILFLFVFLLFIVLIGSLFSKNIMDGFELGLGTPTLGTPSISDLTSSVVKKGIPEEYKYLAPIPDGSVWSPEIQDEFVTVFKQIRNNSDYTTEKLKEPLMGNKTWMQWASQEEAKYFVDNKKWPYDEYVTNYITDNPNFLGTPLTADKLAAEIPNRMLYGFYIAPQTVPQLKFFNQLFSLNFPHEAENNKYWQCTTNGTLQTKDGENGTMADNSDSSFFQNNIAGFSFTGEPCNVCAIPQIRISGQFQDVYNSNQNTCKFTINGDTEAYKVYSGVYGNVLGSDTNTAK